MAIYESEFTQFLRSLKQQRPELEAEQKKGRAIFWDKPPLDLEQTRRDKTSRIAQQPYVYQNKLKTDIG